MEQFTIYCTEDQCRKAGDLGAPIEKVSHSLGEPFKPECTAEQMIGWLESKGIHINLRWHKIGTMWNVIYIKDGEALCIGEGFCERKQAILKSIDVSLAYLQQKNQPAIQ